MTHYAHCLSVALSFALLVGTASALPSELAGYQLDPAPATTSLLLKKGDRLAICGDSITEQKRYSVIIETYLTACLPQLEITCRQYGWSGERASGFLKRMKSDVLRFRPTIATTCYGMNDFKYVPYDEVIATEFRNSQTAVIDAFQETGCRVILGSSGIIDSVPHWVKSATGSQHELNLALSRLRNVAIGVAKSEDVAFADIYQPMLLADHAAKQNYGTDFKVSGKDGVHPDWAGHVIMAYAFLKAMGIDGDLGTITFDETNNRTTTTGQHQILSETNGKITLRSHQLPFSPGPGPIDKDHSIQAGLALVPFHDELNRLTLRLTSAAAAAYTVTWGAQSKNFTGAQLKSGINLAREFDAHPLVAAFQKVQEAVTNKQTYETRQVKDLAHGPEGAADPDATFELTEKARAPLAKAVATSLQPVEHSVTIARAKP